MSRVLVVDDDDATLAAVRHVLSEHHVTTAANATSALVALRAASFDVILTDIYMPDLSGIDLLREVRRTDLDVPVIVMTGDPSVETAMAALELGAYRYITKPVMPLELVAIVARAVTLHRLAKAKRDALELIGDERHLLGDRASLEGRFDAAVDSMWMAFQPIVSQSQRRIIAFEALLRNEEPTLSAPPAFIEAAARLERLEEIGRKVRASVAHAMPTAPAGVDVFVNLHGTDLNDDELLDPSSPLAAFAKRVVLEITERVSLDDIDDAPARVAALRALGYRIAIDDLGAGYAGLTCLASLEPDVVKIDMSLVQKLDSDERRQRVVRSLIALCQELGMMVVAEGIETRGERDALIRVGGDVMQGFDFSRPARAFPRLPEGVWE